MTTYRANTPENCQDHEEIILLCSAPIHLVVCGQAVEGLLGCDPLDFDVNERSLERGDPHLDCWFVHTGASFLHLMGTQTHCVDGGIDLHSLAGHAHCDLIPELFDLLIENDDMLCRYYDAIHICKELEEEKGQGA